jgi:hypothetical protein
VKPTGGKAFIYTADALYTIENMERSIPPPPEDNQAVVQGSIAFFGSYKVTDEK